MRPSHFYMLVQCIFMNVYKGLQILCKCSCYACSTPAENELYPILYPFIVNAWFFFSRLRSTCETALYAGEDVSSTTSKESYDMHAIRRGRLPPLLHQSEKLSASSHHPAISASRPPAPASIWEPAPINWIQLSAHSSINTPWM